MQTLVEQNERLQACIDAHQDEHGSNLEIEAEIKRLKLMKKNYESDLEKKNKELAALGKQ